MVKSTFFLCFILITKMAFAIDWQVAKAKITLLPVSHRQQDNRESPLFTEDYILYGLSEDKKTLLINLQDLYDRSCGTVSQWFQYYNLIKKYEPEDMVLTEEIANRVFILLSQTPVYVMKNSLTIQSSLAPVFTVLDEAIILNLQEKKIEERSIVEALKTKFPDIERIHFVIDAVSGRKLVPTEVPAAQKWNAKLTTIGIALD